MAIHVQDEETDWLVREFARRRGVGLTAAIKLAILEASDIERETVRSVAMRVKPILDEIRAKRQPVDNDEKSFMDSGWGEDE
ncbi:MULTISPECIES: type II toxin-antitoxin system VapB family antitoxin [unclassified Aminobacter]|uniref:type II toxin-antitoxin system VapB family antitoxin n=1 Tax=unclassified Aminobacter TaxID=2644704 RepID=UPI0009FF5976|nr:MULTISPECIES: type II toxin-antitoxin system VapB family antitoxin [unclassified Aminobacter]TWH36651.1 hypothetical protein L611_000100001330 [Aminobacter sp. J15]